MGVNTISSVPWPKVEPVMGWQPIETAPRDGADFLAYYPEGMWVEDIWDEGDQGHAEAVCAVVRYTDNGYLEGNTYFLTPGGEPTHWMHLPKAPTP